MPGAIRHWKRQGKILCCSIRAGCSIYSFVAVYVDKSPCIFCLSFILAYVLIINLLLLHSKPIIFLSCIFTVKQNPTNIPTLLATLCPMRWESIVVGRNVFQIFCCFLDYAPQSHSSNSCIPKDPFLLILVINHFYKLMWFFVLNIPA